VRQGGVRPASAESDAGRRVLFQAAIEAIPQDRPSLQGLESSKVNS
jgi:hypothetical protein